MTVSAAPETYNKMIQYGLKKVRLRFDQLLLQSVAAGFWVGLFGHLCTSLASPLYATDPTSGAAAIAYACFFPGAFIAIVVTGSELFTGNTVTMTLCLLDRRASFLQSLRVWVVSFFGNYIGATFMAFLSWLAGSFAVGTSGYDYLATLTLKKVHYGFGPAIILGVGCNCMVCLALWAVVSSDDGAGKYIGLWFPVAAFAAGGFEHVVANMYTLALGAMQQVEKLSADGLIESTNYGKILLWNIIPVLIGNVLAGTLFTGLLWWYNFHPDEGNLYHVTDDEMLQEVSRRHSKGDMRFAPTGSKAEDMVLNDSTGSETEIEP